MKPITLTLPKIKIQRETFVSIAILLIILIALGALGYLQKTGKLGEMNLSLLLGKLAIEWPKEEKVLSVPSIPPTEEQQPGKESPALIKTYEKKAEPGEGITHLARKALKEYLAEKGTDFDLTPEHKIYIEDYIQNKTGERWLALGENVSISEELITEGINQAQKLSPEQLDNLKQYSSLTPSL